VLPRGHIRILRGNLAPDGAVAKITGKEGERFDAQGWRFEVVDMDGRKIDKLLAVRLKRQRRDAPINADT